jgi:DNA invertase Pin-like site-specific DNA recombinase
VITYRMLTVRANSLIRGLNDGVDTATATGRMLGAILAALAEYERTLINERAQAAREAARARGKQVGRPRAISGEQLRPRPRCGLPGSR